MECFSTKLRSLKVELVSKVFEVTLTALLLDQYLGVTHEVRMIPFLGVQEEELM